MLFSQPFLFRKRDIVSIRHLQNHTLECFHCLTMWTVTQKLYKLEFPNVYKKIKKYVRDAAHCSWIFHSDPDRSAASDAAGFFQTAGSDTVSDRPFYRHKCKLCDRAGLSRYLHTLVALRTAGPLMSDPGRRSWLYHGRHSGLDHPAP